MRTTVRLDDQLLREVKRVAANEGKTMTALIDESLRERLARSGTKAGQPEFALPSFSGDGFVEGLNPEVLFDNARMADLMDGLD